MQIELCCPACDCRLVAPPDTRAEDLMERMFDEGPYFALGDGETFEDMIFATLTEYGNIACPECGEPVMVTEESLGQLALSVLGSW